MYSFTRRVSLAIFLLFSYQTVQSQANRCDSIEWNFNVNQFAIDGDNLMADFEEKGWTPEFFQTNAIDVTIYGATDCPGSYTYNNKLAGYRALYLRNYFEVSAFPLLTIVNSYSIPERNCTRPNQGYNRADRVTALKVCWSGKALGVVGQNTLVNPNSNAIDSGNNPPPLSTTSAETAALSAEDNTPQNEPEPNTEAEVSSVIETQKEPTDSASAPLNSLETTRSATNELPSEFADSTTTVTTATAEEKIAADSLFMAFLDTTYTFPAKPKKVFDISSTQSLNKGDELILEGLNFYPGSHRTLPEAKPVLKKLLLRLQDNPTLIIEIQGHVCCASAPNEDGLDDETGDFKLSWNRAQHVRDYLIQNGIAESRISYRGFAMTRPLVFPEKTIQDQIMNRRVEILVTAE